MRSEQLLWGIAFPLALAALITVVGLAGPDVWRWLRYEREAILAGQLWRLLTGHLVHLGWPHLFMNGVGLLVIGGLFGQVLRVRDWLLTCLTGALAISLGLLLLNPEIVWYVGLSGVLHGLIVTGAILQIRDGHKVEVLLLAAVIVKLLWEQFQGPLPGVETLVAGPVVVAAHLYGAVAGLAVGVFTKKS
jgi:rhomboid family GlyGly-CTERM serine protease